jgi:hypothetical protein
MGYLMWLVRWLFTPITFSMEKGGGGPPPAPPVPSVRSQIPSIFTPAGSRQVGSDPANPGGVKITETLSPEQQRIYGGRSDIAEALLGRSSEAIGAMPASYRFAGAEDPAANRFFSAQKKLLDTTFDRDEERERQRLVNQGIPEGSEAYTSALDDFSRRKADAYEMASANALSTGFNQDITERQQNYNEIAAALSGSQPMPIGQQDISGAIAANQAAQNRAYQGQIEGYRADVGSSNAMIGAGGLTLAAFV